MNICRGHFKFINEFTFGIHLDMILITVKVFAMLCSPSGIYVLLSTLVFGPIFRSFSVLDLIVFVSRISLYW